MPEDTGASARRRALLDLRALVILTLGAGVGLGTATLTFWWIVPGSLAAAILAGVPAGAGTVKFLHEVVDTSR